MHTLDISYHELIHAMKQCIAVVDAGGVIISVNHAWIQNAYDEGVPQSFNWVGINFMQIADALSGEDEQDLDRLQAVLQGISTYYRNEFRSSCIQPSRWFQIEAFPLRNGAREEPRGMIVCLSDISRSKQLENDLMTALSQIRTLRGLLPICAVCKRIRDDDDLWNSIESFLQKHAHTEFTHDICPDCIRRLYPKYSSILDTPTHQ
ncbi:PAS domain-containing protein [Paenibacillus cineris]|uniref:PAS domain-containing protein n=1 Tax=Paenibacillus cineris TaxID=237530 RepID=UPI001B251991|nr:PAS domain-containing protein [Paenibacillus cineris]GIO63517.1 hypothetical protein J43TS9_50910 [Paenibacillus cineris]